MADVRPALSDLIARMRADAAANLQGVDVQLPRSFLDAILVSAAGAVHALYGRLQRIVDDAYPDTASEEALERHASIWGIVRLDSQVATGEIGAAGSPPAIPTGAVLVRGDGSEYETSGPAVDDGDGTWSAPVAARAGGAPGNAVVSSILTWVSPISGLPSTIPVVTALAGGRDEESVADLRVRVLDRLRAPPQGGNASDFLRWTLESGAGITRAWVVPPPAGSNVVDIYAVDDTQTPPAPTAPQLSDLVDYLDERRYLGADVEVQAPTFVDLDPTIHLDPDTAEVRAAVQAEIEDLLIRESELGGGLLLSHLREAISRAAGEADHTLTAPAANVTVAPTELLILGAITWT